MPGMTDDELFARLKAVIARGWVRIPDKYGYGGTGGAGRMLEELLGVDGGNLDIPDAGKWEIKFHTKTALLTLFHLEAQPKGHMHHLVRLYGRRDNKGRLSFRHTIRGRSPMSFYVDNESDRITVRNTDQSDVLWPYWTHDSLINAFAAKFRRLVVVKGERRKPEVRYDVAWAFEEPRVTLFLEAIEKGVVAIDFDARTSNGRGLRNHGTKFRVDYDNLRNLYHRSRKIA